MGGGGSNTFVRALARRQANLGWKPIVVLNQANGECEAPSPPIAPPQRNSATLDVRVLPPVLGTGRKAYYARRPDAAPGVRELFAETMPAVVHFHTLGLAAGMLHLEAAKAIGARTVVTYHTGGISCPQTALLENGSSPCDGRLEIARCTRCRLANRGMPVRLADLLARIEVGDGGGGDGSLIGRLISSRSMTKAFIASFQSAIELIDVFHIQSRWIADVLRRNGVPERKMAFVEMGVSQDPVAYGDRTCEAFNAARPLRLVFAGRCSDVKGIEAILAALKQIDQRAPVSISLLGSGWDSDYGKRLLEPFAGDKRLLAPRVVGSEQMLPELVTHDACLVPSVCLETGPLAVYEAMAAGVPVIGSRLGGIAERIRDNVDGLLFSPGNATELATIIEYVLAAPSELRRLRRNILPQRTFDDMARELDAIYRDR
ncbi:Glycosyl transferase 4-like domain-containing protein [Hyphomicrobium facile]|uniref:Glycosyl transferase 4-like domain-containing protein n=2 Tax=Hyphomicrobium facile TaxID=51670 RepID=A0A1I7NKA3_9HYPH|nr:Glycosyl transferase 4-like domain-containing protein [Hyphomicrobium facile]